MKTLPDVATPEKTKNFSALSWVGMNHIQMPLRYQSQTLSSRMAVFVDLKAGSHRGIHMSRLYQIVTAEFSEKDLTTISLSQLVFNLKESQKGISDSAKIEIHFELPLKRKSLKSEQLGQRLYPFQISAELKNNQCQIRLAWEIQYSSTCPASTALSLELWKESAKITNLSALEWLETLEKMPATPHAQRSVAKLQVELASDQALDLEYWIKKSEDVLQTPVQTLVKRVDEQEFARLNGENPLFCEDAARRIQQWLDRDPKVLHYTGSFEHQESLHPHNAVAKISS